jgi:hypothetical protein
MQQLIVGSGVFCVIRAKAIQESPEAAIRKIGGSWEMAASLRRRELWS